MSGIEKRQPGGRIQPPVPGQAGGRPPVDPGAARIDYVEAGEAPTWESLPIDLRQQCDVLVAERTGFAVDAQWGSFVPPRSVLRRKDGAVYQRQRSWALGPQGLTVADARQFGELNDTKRFYPHGRWEVQVSVLLPGEFQLLRRTLAPSPPSHQVTVSAVNEAIVEASINPYGVDYGGRHGVEWTNLPIDARRMVEEAVPFGVATVETGDVRLEWTDRGAGAALVVSQTIWFERQSKDVLVGVYASRSRAGGLSAGGDEQAQAWIEPQPWGVAAFRCGIDAKGSARALPARGADGPPLPPSNQGRALPPTAH